MKIFGLEIKRSSTPSVPEPVAVTATREPEAAIVYNNFIGIDFDGEKNMGELGPIVNYRPNHTALRYRGWQLVLESEVAQLVIQRFAKWVIGSGLKLQAEPKTDILQSEGLKLDANTFSNTVESRFAVYSNDKMSDYSDMRNLGAIAKEAFINAKTSGDVLVVLRYINKCVKVQLIDGAHLETPNFVSYKDGEVVYPATGNRVKDGIEIDARGKHVAYHIREAGSFKYSRIEARNKYGIITAYMVNGLKYRIDTARHLPLLTAVMESASKLERYKEATLATAEEQAKVVYSIEHGVGSSGENPLEALSRTARSGKPGDIPKDNQGEEVANKIAATANKLTFNMPIDSKLNTPKTSNNQLYFDTFMDKNMELICAAVGIPLNVAMMLYNDSFSASRAAIKDWEHTLLVERKNFADEFYKPVYTFWLTMQVMDGKINAPGYFPAFLSKDEMVTASYLFARWTGANVPHIDPVKEVTAERMKLGKGSEHIPLTTVEQATENLNGGDSYANMKQYAEELEDADVLGIEKERDIPKEVGLF